MKTTELIRIQVNTSASRRACSNNRSNSYRPAPIARVSVTTNSPAALGSTARHGATSSFRNNLPVGSESPNFIVPVPLDSEQVITEVTDVGDLSSQTFILPHNISLMPGGEGGGGGTNIGASTLHQTEVSTGPGNQCSLRWNNHSSTFCQVLSALRDKDKYSDVTLACEGRFYNVHRLVLGICSDYFDAMLERTPCKHPVIVLRDMKAEDLESLLSYMYLGEVSVSQSDLGRLVKAAGQLCIKGLTIMDDSPTTPPGQASGSYATTEDENAAVGLASNVGRDNKPGLIYANNGNVIPFVTPHTQAHHHQDVQQATVHPFRTSGNAARGSPASKRRRKDDSSIITSSSAAASPSISPPSSVIDATGAAVDDATAAALVYQEPTAGTSAGTSLGVNVAGVSVAVGAAAGSNRTPPDYDSSTVRRDHHHHHHHIDAQSILQVVDDSIVKEELQEGNGRGRGSVSSGGVVTSVLTAAGSCGKNQPTISYVVTTDHAGNIHAQQHTHDPRFDPHTGGGTSQTGAGQSSSQHQPLEDAVAEALTGTSGMQTWLSSPELSQTGFTTVETYSNSTNTDSSHHTVALKHSTPAHTLDGAAGVLSSITTTSNNNSSTSASLAATSITVAAAASATPIAATLVPAGATIVTGTVGGAAASPGTIMTPTGTIISSNNLVGALAEVAAAVNCHQGTGSNRKTTTGTFAGNHPIPIQPKLASISSVINSTGVFGSSPHTIALATRSVASSTPITSNINTNSTSSQQSQSTAHNNTSTGNNTSSNSSSTPNQLVCPHCMRSTFRQTSDLKRHIRIHTGEKPYQCHSCPYRASRKDLLHTHCAKLHPNVSVKTETGNKDNHNKHDKDGGDGSSSTASGTGTNKRKWTTQSSSPEDKWEWSQ